MTDRGPASVDEVILAFLRAEIESPRWQTQLRRLLTRTGLSINALLGWGALPEHRTVRTRLLCQHRGYPRRSLFRDWPSDVSWRHVDLPARDFWRLKYLAQVPKFEEITASTLRVCDGADRIDSIETAPENNESKNFNDHVRETAASLRSTIQPLPLIGVETHDGDVIILEGSTRATTHVYAVPSRPMRLIVGASPRMHQWYFYAPPTLLQRATAAVARRVPNVLAMGRRAAL